MFAYACTLKTKDGKVVNFTTYKNVENAIYVDRNDDNAVEAALEYAEKQLNIPRSEWKQGNSCFCICDNGMIV